ncbi:MAG: hypothetical protein HYS86_01665 [Candidatus Chisholmbacteria bacterium]|nr:hypothetical protein [Candidatus Chisholmbacteria bacterium]
MSNTQKVSEVRTQVYFPRSTYRLVKKHAQIRNVSIAQVIREAVADKITSKKTSTTKSKAYDLLKYAGSLSGGPKDFSENPSNYLKKMYQEMPK